ncbi:unnamed protein product [Leuciscus chuanchicus]
MDEGGKKNTVGGSMRSGVQALFTHTPTERRLPGSCLCHSGTLILAKHTSMSGSFVIHGSYIDGLRVANSDPHGDPIQCDKALQKIFSGHITANGIFSCSGALSGTNEGDIEPN